MSLAIAFNFAVFVVSPSAVTVSTKVAAPALSIVIAVALELSIIPGVLESSAGTFVFAIYKSPSKASIRAVSAAVSACCS